MQKKQLLLILVVNIFLILFSGIIVRWLTNKRLQSFGIAVENTMGNKVKTLTQSNFEVLQSHLVETIDTAKLSTVTITISKDVKFYLDDPAQLNGPGNISQQTTTLWGWSGIIISKKGYVLTNKHIIQDTTAKYAVTLSDGTSYNVNNIRFDNLLDIAILKLETTSEKNLATITPATFLPFTTEIQVGQFAITIGNMLSKYPYSVSMGIIWGKNKQLMLNGKNLYIGLYQTDAQTNPGNSWGPLLDINGNVIGITTAISEGEGISFALPISQEFIDSTLLSLETFWKISRPILGIQYQEITPSLQKEKNITTEHGIYLTDVLSDLPAWEAWLKVWDSIVAINGQEISSSLPFLYQLYTYIPWETIDVHIIRDNAPIKISLTLWWNTQ